MEIKNYKRDFIPYALCAFLIGIVGGFSTVLGPAFVQDLGIAYNNTTWTALAQAMSTAAFAPILGKLGDVLGRRRTLLLGLAVFTAGNVLTAFSQSLGFMLVARFVVGVGTAAMSPVIMAYIVTRFPPDRVARGFSTYMLISSASVIFGPALGGLFVAHLGWRSMIWCCVGICAAVAIGCLLFREKATQKVEKIRQFDGWGGALVLVFFSLLLCVPSFGQNFGWTSAAFGAVLGGALLSLAALILAEHRAKNPILPGSYMKSRPFLLSVLILFLTLGLLQANMTNTIVFVNYTQPGNATVSGYAISVMYLGMSLGALFLGPLADRREPRAVLATSLVLTGSGCGLMLLFSHQTPLWLLMAALGILGLGLGGNGTILMKIALSGLTGQQAGTVTGTYGLFRDLAAPFGVAIFVPLFTNQIAVLESGGIAPATAAIRSIHLLAVVEIGCIVAGLLAALWLPGRKNIGN